MKRFSLHALLIAVLAVAGCADGPAGPAATQGLFFAVGQQPNTWTVLTNVPTASPSSLGVEGMSVASVDNKIIAALGNEEPDKATTRIYDVDGDTWSFGANAPGPNAEGAGVAHGGLFYSIGGRFMQTPRADIWSYDPATDTWNASLTPMSLGRTGLAVAAVGNSLYAIGGRTTTSGPCSGFGTHQLASVERYDIATDSWTTVASLPSARSDLAAATVGGKIYVFGGCRGDETILNDVDVYDPVTDTWSTAPSDMPTARAAMYAVATRGGTVYVIGGWDGIGNGLSTNEAYEVPQDQWTTGLPPMPTPRAEAGIADYGGRIFVVGGGQPGFGSPVAAMEVFKP